VAAEQDTREGQAEIPAEASSPPDDGAPGDSNANASEATATDTAAAAPAEPAAETPALDEAQSDQSPSRSAPAEATPESTQEEKQQDHQLPPDASGQGDGDNDRRDDGAEDKASEIIEPDDSASNTGAASGIIPIDGSRFAHGVADTDAFRSRNGSAFEGGAAAASSGGSAVRQGRGRGRAVQQGRGDSRGTGTQRLSQKEYEQLLRRLQEAEAKKKTWTAEVESVRQQLQVAESRRDRYLQILRDCYEREDERRAAALQQDPGVTD